MALTMLKQSFALVCATAFITGCGPSGAISFNAIDPKAISEISVNNVRTSDRQKIERIVDYLNHYRTGFDEQSGEFATVLRIYLFDKAHRPLQRSYGIGVANIYTYDEKNNRMYENTESASTSLRKLCSELGPETFARCEPLTR